MPTLKDIKSHVINNPLKEIEINGAKVNIKTYLPIEDKYGLIDLAVRNSIDYGRRIVDKMKVDIFFSYLVVKTYSDIELNIDNLNEEYDMLESNGIIDIIFNNIPKTEIEFLLEHLETEIKQEEKYLNSIYSILDMLAEKLDTDVNKIMSQLQNLDLDKLENVKHFYEVVSGQN